MLHSARQKKQAKYSELLGVETGGRFGQEKVDFMDSLAAATSGDAWSGTDGFVRDLADLFQVT